MIKPLPVGQKFNQLTLLAEAPWHSLPSGDRARRALFSCDCGNFRTSFVGLVRAGVTKSCGCFRKQRMSQLNTSHLMSRDPTYAKEYRAWASMKQRCLSPIHPSYKDYGARGIIICSNWVKDFSQFFEDMGFANGLTLERVDNDKGYSKDNCKWATRKEQAQNRRMPKPKRKKL